jgi:hypothetical protein
MLLRSAVKHAFDRAASVDAHSIAVPGLGMRCAVQVNRATGWLCWTQGCSWQCTHVMGACRDAILCCAGCGIFGWPASVACFEIVRALQEWARVRNAARAPYPMRVVLFDFKCAPTCTRPLQLISVLPT